MSPIVFTEDKDCKRCPLHEGVQSVCVPTVAFAGGLKPKDKALVIVGEAPGGNEDKQNRPFVGRAGLMLREVYIEFFKLTSKADVYLSNAVRCRPPQNKDPNKTQLKCCQGFLLSDLAELQKSYKEVLILAVGGTAAQCVRGTSLKKSFAHQGEMSDFKAILPKQPKTREKYGAIIQELLGGKDYPIPCPVFTTYHPAYILREPSQGLAVKTHLQLLSDYLDGTLTTEFKPEELEIQVAPPPPSYPLVRLTFDIETYGLFKNLPPQTMFHPKKSVKHDGVARSAMIRTTGLTWRDPEGKEHHAVFLMQNSQHRRRLWSWFRACHRSGSFEYLLGQNIVFDLMYLRYCYPECKLWLNDSLPIMDLLVLNYLHNEGRPEKSLKNLAPLFGVTKYDTTRPIRRYVRDDDPDLWAYNCQDTFATLRLSERLEQEIRSFYGAQTQKLSPFCMQWYSDLLWLIVWMSEEGIRMDQGRLESLFSRYSGALGAILTHSTDAYDAPLRGKGSELAKRAAMQDAFDEVRDFNEVWGHGPPPKMQTTDVLGYISYCEENRNALMDPLDNNSPQYKRLKLIGSYQDVSGVMDRYLYPLLVGRGKKHDKLDSTLIDGVAYPVWFPVPSEYEDKSAGGTKQARIVAKSPPCQTFPPLIKQCIIGRFNGGWLVWFDYSQIELRVAALLSNDPVMMAEYLGNPDFHTKTAQLVFGDDIVNHPNFYVIYRQAGKTLNFLMLYRGGAFKFHQTLMTDVGLDYPMRDCERAIAMFRERHRRLFEWQDEMIEFVRTHNYYELPLIGQSRLFCGGTEAKAKAEKEIANLPVQAIAADIMLSGQFVLWSEFKKRKMEAIVPVNVYDAAAIECPLYDLPQVKATMYEVLPNPPYYQALCKHLGRTLPLVCEANVYRMKRVQKTLTEEKIIIAA